MRCIKKKLEKSFNFTSLLNFQLHKQCFERDFFLFLIIKINFPRRLHNIWFFYLTVLTCKQCIVDYLNCGGYMSLFYGGAGKLKAFKINVDKSYAASIVTEIFAF